MSGAINPYIPYQYATHEIESTEQISVLSYLYKHPLATQSDIARATHRERGSISRILAGMERQGWIKRSTLDRRTNGVELTRRGLETYQVLVPINDQIGVETLANCAKRDIDATVRLLKKLASTRKSQSHRTYSRT